MIDSELQTVNYELQMVNDVMVVVWYNEPRLSMQNLCAEVQWRRYISEQLW